MKRFVVTTALIATFAIPTSAIAGDKIFLDEFSRGTINEIRKDISPDAAQCSWDLYKEMIFGPYARSASVQIISDTVVFYTSDGNVRCLKDGRRDLEVSPGSGKYWSDVKIIKK